MTRGWAFEDIVEVTRIASTAVSTDGRRAAAILATPSITEDRVRYIVGELDLSEPDALTARFEAPFLADVQADPKGAGWSLLADVGAGVQLYRLSARGALSPLVINSDVARVGGAMGDIPSSMVGERDTGVVAYGWNPDGSALWYVRLAAQAPRAQQRWWDEGLRYDPVTMSASDLQASPPRPGVELRILEIASGADRLVAAAPGDRSASGVAFDRGQVRWRDAQTLEFALLARDGAGRLVSEPARFDRATGALSILDAGRSAALEAPFRGGGLRVVRTPDGSRRLQVLSDRGSTITGPTVDFGSIGGALGSWRAPSGEALYGVTFADRVGLFGWPATATTEQLSEVPDSLTACSFDRHLDLGVCSRESRTRAPELVVVSPRTGALRVVARPNARYDAIAPLQSERLAWTNADGRPGDGVVTYPRDFRPGQRYPAVVLTHAADARNTFADPGFQWAFPLQVLAERGYMVIAVNERSGDPPAAAAYSGQGALVGAARMQESMGHRAVTTLEGALDLLAERGLIDSDRVGIAGYSRGGIVTTLALSHSKRFRAGISADTALFNPSGYWRSQDIRVAYRALFGGPPSDRTAQVNYRAFAPAWRADAFSGPLMQLVTAKVAPFALELDTALREAGVPTELISYPNETHVLHRPRTARSAMSASLAWFDFWLLDRCDPVARDAAVSCHRWRGSEPPFRRAGLTSAQPGRMGD